MSKMKYLVAITNDYNATLYVGTSFKEVEKLETMMLDKKLPLNHGEHRINIETMMSNNKVIPLTHDFKKWNKTTDILFGEALYKMNENKIDPSERKKNHKQKMKKLDSELMANESGFSLIELAVCAAILLTLSAISLPYINTYNTNMSNNIETLKQQQIDNAFNNAQLGN